MSPLQPCRFCRTLRPILEPCPCCGGSALAQNDSPLRGAPSDQLLRHNLSATPLRGTLVGDWAKGLLGRELRDKVWQLLVRQVEEERGQLALDLDGERIPIVGRVIVTRVVRHRPTDSEQARALLRLEEDLVLPRYLLRVDTAVFVGEEIAVRGPLISFPEARTYREVSFTRQLLGKVGQPLIVGLAKKEM